MRIISGNYKGKKIEYLKSKKTRPLKDAVKESIFNILLHSKKVNIKISRANILDLYSGTGSFGLECFSRGANKIFFFENDIEVFNILKKNTNQYLLEKKIEIINSKAENFKTFLFNEKFDIVFLDPPFKEKNLINIISKIKKEKILKKKHVLIIHREKGSKDDFDSNLNILLEKKYGRSKIIFAKII